MVIKAFVVGYLLKWKPKCTSSLYVYRELLDISHIRTIYHIFVAILIVFSLQTIVYDFIDKGRIVMDFELMVWTFGKFPIVMSIWACMILSTISVIYPLFQHWASRRPGKVGQ